MGDSGPPPHKNGHFLPKNGPEIPFLGQKQSFLGLCGQFNAPQLFLAAARNKKTCSAGLGSQKMGDSGLPPLKNGHLLPKNGLTLPILGQKECFLGSGGQFDAPPPYFAGARFKRVGVAALGRWEIGDSGTSP